MRRGQGAETGPWAVLGLLPVLGVGWLPLPVLAQVPPPPIVMPDLTLGQRAPYAALDELLRAQRDQALQEREKRLPAPAVPVRKTPLQQSLHAAHPANALPPPMPPVEPFGGKEACVPHSAMGSPRTRGPHPPPCRCKAGPLQCPPCLSAKDCS